VTLTWPDLVAAQQPSWDGTDALAAATAELRTYPPLVFAGECDNLRDRLAAAARGEAFLLQGGDCAETFADATADAIRRRVKTILQMAVVLMYGGGLPVVKMGRMAGQFAKPRSKDTETRDGVTLPAYRGDAVNAYEFTEQARAHDPQRLVRAYHTAASTLNLIRAFTTGGFADLRHVHEWNRGFTINPANARYEVVAREIDKAMRFMAACGADFDALRGVEFFASHEALLLDYERALTRIDSRTGLPYATSAHFVWVGERTRGWTARTSSSRPGCRTRSGSSSARRRPRTTPSRSSRGWTRTASRAGSPSSPAWAPTRSGTCCRPWWRRCAPPGHSRCGSPTRCTATRSSPPAATRPAGSTTSSTRSAASSRCTARWARCRAACTWS
jgi:hypothetical protein